jgi:hypothetical protein
LMAATITPGANWRKRLNSIFMISASRSQPLGTGEKIPTRRSRDETC